MVLRFLTYVLFILFASALEAEEGGDAAQVSKAMGASLQGSAVSALGFLRDVEPSNLNSKSKEFYSCMIERFNSTGSAANTIAKEGTFTAELTGIFRSYWHKSLTAPETRDLYGQQLNSELKQLLGLEGDITPGELDSTIHLRLSNEGNYGLLGQTGALRELMVWSKEERKKETVKMPHGHYLTSVAYLDEFIEPGWGQYATCEQRGAGGWVADRTLFAVVPVYDDIEGEEFRVTFLGHETQHFLDLDTYDNMQSWELEYRAKLMELSMADKTLANVLQKFVEDQRDDPSYHHSYANYKLLGELVSELSLATPFDLYNVDREKINEAAFSLFKADTVSRNSISRDIDHK